MCIKLELHDFLDSSLFFPEKYVNHALRQVLQLLFKSRLVLGHRKGRLNHGLRQKCPWRKQTIAIKLLCKEKLITLPKRQNTLLNTSKKFHPPREVFFKKQSSYVKPSNWKRKFWGYITLHYITLHYITVEKLQKWPRENKCWSLEVTLQDNNILH